MEEVFKLIHVDVPISIEVKDKDSVEAAKATVELIRKYKRHHSTVVGGESTSVTKRLLSIDPELATICGV